MNQLNDGTVLPELDFEGRQRSAVLEGEDHETLAWYAASLEDTILHVSSFLVGNGDVAEIARGLLRRPLAKGAIE
jgi:hypothetical protein